MFSRGKKMNVQNILLAMEELERWERRKVSLHEELIGLEDEMKKGVLNELKKIDTQIEYYKDLIRDMKMKTSPPSMLGLSRKRSE